MEQFTLTGDFREIGRQYGSACRRSIKVFTTTIQAIAVDHFS